MSEPVVHLSDTGDASATTPLMWLPDTTNFAKDADVANFVERELWPLILWIRDTRVELEEEWNSIQRMEAQIHDGGRRYLGRSDAYLPLYDRNLAVTVAALSSGLFPSDEYMDVVDQDTGDPARARPVKAYAQWELEAVGRARSYMKAFLRQFTNFGNSVLRIDYRKKVTRQGRLGLAPNLFGGPTPYGNFQQICQEGLSLSVRPIHNVYFFPLTADTIDDCSLVFETAAVPISYIEKMGRLRKWENVDFALAHQDTGNYDAHTDQRLQDMAAGLTNPAKYRFNQVGGHRVLIEVWTFMKLPRAAYGPDEDPEDLLPVRMVLAGHKPLLVTRNPYWHQRIPYRIARQNVAPGLFYGSGVGRRMRPLQYLANDFMNQTLDAGTYELNPIIIANPGMLAGPLPPIKPGALWKTTNVNEGIRFDRPGMGVLGSGLNMQQFLQTLAQDLSGAPKVLQGAKGGDTATATQILQHNALTPLHDVVEDIENDVMVPLLYMLWVNAQQFREQGVIAMAAGEPVQIDPVQLAINAEFRWLASSQAVNKMQRAQQGMQFIQMVAPLVPLLNMNGYVFNPVPVLNRIYSDGLGWRGFEQVIAQSMQPAMAAQGGMQPGAVPGVVQEQGDRMRSAVEQAPGGEVGMDMAAGEGGEFMNVRSNADDLAALLGGGGFQ